jgi:hypothetical protein
MPESGEYPKDFMNVKAFVEGVRPYAYVSRAGERPAESRRQGPEGQLT